MTATPESLGISSEGLNKLDRHLAEAYVESGKIPGFALLVERDGAIIHDTQYGMRDSEAGDPIEPDTMYRIYSMTKPITSAAFMMLVEEGKASLIDPVHKYIPSWEGLSAYRGGARGSFETTVLDRPMTVLDLMTHTSGLTYAFQERTPVDAAYRDLKIGTVDTDRSMDEMVSELAHLPLEFSPGSAWNYSLSTDVLAYLVQSISGMPYEEFLQQRFFEPLGMVDTGFYVPQEKAHRLGALYFAGEDGNRYVWETAETSRFRHPPKFVSGGGGLVSTTADYLQFCRMMQNKGSLDGRVYLRPETVDLMMQNHLPGGRTLHDMSVSLFSEQGYAGVGFGLGFALTIDPAASNSPTSKGEAAWGGMASTFFWLDPIENLTVIFMTQVMPSMRYPIRSALRDYVYASLRERRA